MEEFVEGEEDVAAVEVAGLGEDAVVGGAEVGEFGLGGIGARLELVDLGEQLGEEAGRVAPNCVVAQGQVVEAVEQDREALGGAEDVEERVQAGGGGVLTQEALGKLTPGADPELLVVAGEERFGAPQKAAGSRLGGCQDEDSLGRQALLDQAGEAPGQRLGLAAARGSGEQERTPVVFDRTCLGLGQSEHGPTLASARPP